GKAVGRGLREFKNAAKGLDSAGEEDNKSA
ncbi:MAG TPA: twin-arginine translocase TatA/TatE family subunit, partial [Firmicutes bacterium]|nr:twin-arginine translocase TatA/TatE family subunit [Bacillota bacterium]